MVLAAFKCSCFRVVLAGIISYTTLSTFTDTKEYVPFLFFRRGAQSRSLGLLSLSLPRELPALLGLLPFGLTGLLDPGDGVPAAVCLLDLLKRMVPGFPTFASFWCAMCRSFASSAWIHPL
jgi:hypothetical protein